MSTEHVYVGIDVAQETFDVAIHGRSDSWTATNNTSGIVETLARLVELQPSLVVMESTGGLETALMLALTAADVPVVVVNPARIRYYAKALGRLAKTDRLDAAVIAAFAEATKPAQRAQPNAEAVAIKALFARRSQVTGMIAAEKNRLSRAHVQIRPLIEQHIAWMQDEIATIDKDLDAKLYANKEYTRREQQLTTVPGVGKTVARALIIGLPELGRLDRKKIAALVGVVPYNHDSGKYRGKRFVCGGRSTVRTALYMAALVGTRFNPIIKVLYARLIKAGKCKMVALTACIHKLLLILNAMAKNETTWRSAAA